MLLKKSIFAVEFFLNHLKKPNHFLIIENFLNGFAPNI